MRCTAASARKPPRVITLSAADITNWLGTDIAERDLVYYSDVSAILLLIIASVMVIDLVTERIRHSLIASEQSR